MTNGFIPNGMIEKELRWEYVNYGLYHHLKKVIPYSRLKEKITQLIELQEKQLHLFHQVNAYNRNTAHDLPRTYEGPSLVDEVLAELESRELHLFREYQSLEGYFSAGQRQGLDLIQHLIRNKDIQLGLIAEVKQCFEKEEMNEDRQDYYLEDGYVLEKVAESLTYPTAVTFNDQGELFVIEAGFAYGATPGEGRILKINDDGSYTEFVGGFKSPLTSIAWHEGYFYVTEAAIGEEADPGCGKVIKVSPNGNKKVIVSNLRSCGDHFTGDLKIGPDGKLYFTVGTATNSGVVGTDNMRWVKDKPQFHDVPARDFVLKGKNFTTRNPLTPQDDVVETGAFKPFGVPSEKNEVIKGDLYANGVIYRCDLDGNNLEVYADGFRMPFGLAFSPENGKMYVTDNGADLRGSRPVYEDWDNMWEVTKGGWHGWPDFFSGLPATHPHFHKEGKPKLEFVIKNHPPLASQPVVRFEPHTSSDKFSFSTNSAFGYVGNAFVGQLGAMDAKSGLKVVRVNVKSGQVRDFYVNKRGKNIKDAPMRPVAAIFDPSGEDLYVVDFGVLGREKNTGSLWRIKKEK